MNTHNGKKFIGIDKDGFSEKVRKYGDPKKNLIFTLVFICIVTISITFFLIRNKNEGVTPEYLENFPANTSFYIDSKLTNKEINRLNELTHLNIKGLPDIFNKIFADNYNDKNRKKISSLMNQALSNSFCFGKWNDVAGSKIIEKNLAIFSIKRESKVLPLFKLLTDNKLLTKTFKGYKITYSSDKNFAFLVAKNTLYVTDSRNTMEDVIKNNFINNSNNLYKNKEIRKAVSHLEKDRLATIIIPNTEYEISKVKFNVGNILLENALNNIKQVTTSMKATAISVNIGKKMLYLNFYTPLDFSKIKNVGVKDSLKEILKTKSNKFTPEYLPANTLGFAHISNVSNYINLILDLCGIKSSSQYEQVKQFIKMLTALDFDNDIIKAFESNTVIASIPVDDSKQAYITIFENNEKSKRVFSKLLKLIQLQIPSVKAEKFVYKDNELNTISSPSLPVELCYGAIGQKLYAFGEKLAIQKLIDTSIKNEKNLATSKNYQSFKSNNPTSSKLIVYLSPEEIKYLANRAIVQENQIPVNKIRRNIKGALFTVKSTSNMIKSSLQISLR